MIEEVVHGDVPIIHVHGLPCAGAAARLARSLTDHLRRFGVVVVGLDATNDALLGALRVAPRSAGRWPLTDLHLSIPDPAAAQACREAGVDRAATLHPSLSEAVTAARARRPVVSAHVSLPAGRRSPQRARSIVEGVCGGRVPETVARDATLVVSELATNAIRHSCESIEVISLLTRDRLVVAVHDTSPAHPVLAGADLWLESGRGLVIVEAVSDNWGVRAQDDDGKTVWSSFSVRG